MKDSEEKKLYIYSTRYGENCIIIQIRDSGKGINQKEMDQLFESFYTTKEQGLGMGLPIAKTIVESIQGDIWAELNDQGGASFFVTLPTDVSKQH
jgi:signal transduction histidine kinase